MPKIHRFLQLLNQRVTNSWIMFTTGNTIAVSFRWCDCNETSSSWGTTVVSLDKNTFINISSWRVNIQGVSNQNIPPDKMQFLDNRVKFFIPKFLGLSGRDPATILKFRLVAGCLPDKPRNLSIKISHGYREIAVCPVGYFNLSQPVGHKHWLMWPNLFTYDPQSALQKKTTSPILLSACNTFINQCTPSTEMVSRCDSIHKHVTWLHHGQKDDIIIQVCNKTVQYGLHVQSQA